LLKDLTTGLMYFKCHFRKKYLKTYIGLSTKRPEASYKIIVSFYSVQFYVDWQTEGVDGIIKY
jgi:hypothetical protein